MWRIQHLGVFASLLGLLALAFALQGCGQEAAGPCVTGESQPHLQCGIGACYAFIESCRDGIPQSCGPLVAKSAETHDGIDNDCNGVVDDGIPCNTFESQDCYSGSPIYAGKGLCQSGTQICQQGTWSFCTGDLMPQEELCNQRDDDCDGEVDEVCSCVEGARQTCYGGAKGTEFTPPCRTGQQACTNGRWGKCEGDIVPTVEQPDGIDNDCDGRIDEGFPCQTGEVRGCYGDDPSTKGIGQCREGMQTCEQGTWGNCVGETLPKQEICDGLDNNCDGTPDNGDFNGMPCETGLLGLCNVGESQCIEGEIYCSPSFTPAVETCDTVDNNCDGVVDNGAFCCPDGKKNGNESDVDCGGSCPKCLTGKLCNLPGDCENSACNFGQCVAATCIDGLKNGKESDKDCGGGDCAGCGDGGICLSGLDCTSHVCTGNMCAAPTCDDGVKNANETDIDCAGSCPKCDSFRLCNKSFDCQSGVCLGGICQPPQCSDSVKNGNESDIDCGGPFCPECSPGQLCSLGADCISSVCIGNICQPPSCSDFVKNGIESDIDCGGSCPLKCDTGKICFVGADCQSAVCIGSFCQPPGCNDSVKNANESDIDCGGPICIDCGTGKSCIAGADCQSAVCIGSICQPSFCTDSVKNGTESDIDCGGPTCADCGTGKSCLIGADCQSGVCISGICQAPSCNDSVKNANESDIDCGGNTCIKCQTGKVCFTGSDCLSGVCINNTCQAPVCGDGVKNGAEGCDDGNVSNNDGCSGSCVVELGYTCNGTPSVCVTTCGDGIKAGGEQCDDNNLNNGDGCTSACTVQSGYTCIGQPSVCTPVCGDGIKAGAEQCDDSNFVNGDGCNSVCGVELGYSCTPASPSACSAVCGDQFVRGTEQCDDGNNVPMDGCSPTCTWEILLESGDFGGTVGTAAPIQLNQIVAGTINNGSDKDWFQLPVSATPVTLRIETFDSSFGANCMFIDTTVTVFNADASTVMFTSNNDGIGLCSAMVVELSNVAASCNGVSCFIEVAGNSGDNYTLQVKEQKPSAAESEMNGTTGTANQVPTPPGSDVYVSGTRTPNDSDYFSVFVPQGKSIRAEVLQSGFGLCTMKNPRLTLHNPAGAQLVQDEDDAFNSLCPMIDGTGSSPLDAAAGNLPAGTYYLRVDAADNTAGGPGDFSYQLAVTVR